MTKYILGEVPLGYITKGARMSAASGFMDWLFGTRPGVACPVVGGIILFLIIAVVLERKTRREFYNHEKSEDDWDLFDDDDESGWSDFDEDNH